MIPHDKSRVCTVHTQPSEGTRECQKPNVFRQHDKGSYHAAVSRLNNANQRAPCTNPSKLKGVIPV